MAEKCLKCFRPKITCYCPYIIPIESGIKFVFLMHPKEAFRQHTGTGRLASLSLIESEIIVGVDFSKNKRLNTLIEDSKYKAMLLYPGEESIACDHQSLVQAKEESKQLLIVVLDATWFFAKKMLRLSSNVRMLPKISFSKVYQSQFIFKRQPAIGYVSTIESCYYLLKEMQQANLVSKEINVQPLMDVFKRMVDFQIKAEQERIASGVPGRHAYDLKRDKKNRKP